MNTTERNRLSDPRAMAALGMLVFAGLCVASGPEAARAQGRNSNASEKPKATPSPSPTACSSRPPAAGIDLAIYLKDRDAACFQPASPPSESPSPGKRPALYSADDEPDRTGLPNDAAAVELDGPIDSTGLTFKYAMQSAGNAVRRINGVPMDPHEHRVTIKIIKVDAADSYAPVKDPLERQLTIEVNANGACDLQGSGLSDPQVAGCTPKFPALGTPSPVPSPGTKQSGSDAKASPSPTPTPSTFSVVDSTKWRGTVSVPLSILTPTLDPSRGIAWFQLCAYETDAAPAAAQVSAAYCRPVEVSFENGWDGDTQYDYDLGSGHTGSGSSASSQNSGASATTLALHRFATSTAASPAPATATTANGQKWGGDIAFEHPFEQFSRLSAQFQDTDLLSALGTAATQNLLSNLAQSVPAYSSGQANNGSATNAESFATIDQDVLGRLLPVPVRGFSEASISKSDAHAFDSVNFLDLVPFDPTQIVQLTYGGKVSVVDNNSNALAFGYFRDGSQNASGTIAHADYTFFQDAGNLSLGASLVSADDAYGTTGKPSNGYLVYPGPNQAFPTSASTPVLHDVNQAYGFAYNFGYSDGISGVSSASAVSRAYTISSHVATDGYGSDDAVTGSFSDPGAGRASGPGAWSESLLAGYRTINYAYAPLFMAYNPFAGNELEFARGAVAYHTAGTQTQCDNPTCPLYSGQDQTYSVSLSAAKAQNQYGTNYSSLGVTATAAIPPYHNAGKLSLSLDAVYLRSSVAGSIVARQSGAYVVDPVVANTLLTNNTSSLTLNATFAKNLTLGVGESATYVPTCSSATKCSSSFVHALNASATASSGRLLLNATVAPGAAQPGQAATNQTPANQVVINGVVAYHLVCSGGVNLEPNVTYKNSIPGTGSAFTPGNLIVESADISFDGFLSGYAIRVSHSNASTPVGLPVPLPKGGWSFTLISAGQTIWHQYSKTSDDPCVSKP